MDRENNHSANKNKQSVNTVSCILLNILASIYQFESFTWIPIQIFYIHGHFKLTQWAWAACEPCSLYLRLQ